MSGNQQIDQMISRCAAIIESCRTPDQLQVARRYIRLASRRYAFNFGILFLIYDYKR